jgi:hypothetical protein
MKISHQNDNEQLPLTLLVAVSVLSRQIWHWNGGGPPDKPTANCKRMAKRYKFIDNFHKGNKQSSNSFKQAQVEILVMKLTHN